MKPSNETYSIGTMNLYYKSDYYFERINQIFDEARHQGIKTLLLQEIADKHLTELFLLAEEKGYKYHAVAPSRSRRTKEKTISSGVFSTDELKVLPSLDLTMLPGSQPSAVASTVYNGRTLLFISVHYAWGAENGQTRLKQSIALANYARRVKDSPKGKNTIIIVGGTFNDLPQSDTLRYLRGEKTSDDIASTFWVDLTEGSDIHNQYTSIGDSYWHFKYNQSENFDPKLIPNRTVDYLLGYGWLYGGVGSPLDASFFGETMLQDTDDIPLSDHRGVKSTLWIPAAN
jgi:hypothetical protein